MTTPVLIHGRGQHTPRDFPADRVPAFAADIRGRWLQALGAGLADAGVDPVPEDTRVVFPFYGNAFRDAVDAREGNGPGPDLALWTMSRRHAVSRPASGVRGGIWTSCCAFPGCGTPCSSWRVGSVVAYDVRDVVAILNPLAPYLVEAVDGQIRDLRVDTGAEPHTVVGYLEQAEVAGAVGEALTTMNAL